MMDTPHPISPRQACKEDLCAIAALETTCFSDAWSEASLKDTLNAPYARLICVDVGHDIAAYACLYLLGDGAELLRIATHPAHRRCGLAHMLMQACIKEAKAAGAQSIYLEVRASNGPAIALYDSYGFVTDLVRKDYYKNPTEDALCRSLSLH